MSTCTLTEVPMTSTHDDDTPVLSVKIPHPEPLEYKEEVKRAPYATENATAVALSGVFSSPAFFAQDNGQAHDEHLMALELPSPACAATMLERTTATKRPRRKSRVHGYFSILEDTTDVSHDARTERHRGTPCKRATMIGGVGFLLVALVLQASSRMTTEVSPTPVPASASAVTTAPWPQCQRADNLHSTFKQPLDLDSHGKCAWILGDRPTFHDLDREKEQLHTIALLEAYLKDFPREADPTMWSSVHFELGTAYRKCLSGKREENYERAIGHLAMITREHTPSKEWASSTHGRSRALHDHGSNDESSEKVASLELALDKHAREPASFLWAAAQMELGITLRGRHYGRREENIERAIDHFKAALEVFTREVDEKRWAALQNELGATYDLRIRGERAANQKTAVQYFVAALSVAEELEDDAVDAAESL